MRRFWLLVPVLALLAAPVAGSAAQSVSVTLNGQPVRITRARPMVVGGGVMVPFADVMRQMGAIVTWDADTRTLNARRPGCDIELTLGSRDAIVNGMPVVLDSPAQVISGSTMVPLRFVGQATGAEVKWDPATRTVAISIEECRVGAGPAISIESVTETPRGWLGIGSVLKVDMRGPRGGVATFEVPGVVDLVPMREVTPGRYTGTWIVPSGRQLVVYGGKIIGLLDLNGEQQLGEATSPVSIDTIAPAIGGMSPEAGSTVNTTQPSISVVIDDNGGSGVDADAFTISVDGNDVTSEANMTSGILVYRPEQPLQTGRNSIAVTARDRAGNLGSRTWTFQVQGSGKAIREFATSDVSNLRPGETITASMLGQPEGQASFSIVSAAGYAVATQSMQEVSPGLYQGAYVVPINSNLAGTTIQGTLTLPSGQTYTMRSAGVIALAPGREPHAPTITSPLRAVPTDSPLIVTGAAPPNSRVRLKVDYSSNILGVFRSSGQLTDQTIDVGPSGRWKSRPISLTTLIRGKNTRYTITATTIGPRGQESRFTAVTVRGL